MHSRSSPLQQYSSKAVAPPPLVGQELDGHQISNNPALVQVMEEV